MTETMQMTSLDEWLQAVREHAPHSRLLLVFVRSELPPNATAEQKAHFEAGNGGALVPTMCVDRTPQELESFAALEAESRQFELPTAAWTMVFTATLGGQDGVMPESAHADPFLQRMVEEIKRGEVARFALFNRQGLAVNLL